MQLSISQLRNAVHRLMKPDDATDPSIFYKGQPFLDGYIAHTNWRVAQDPREAIGGRWEEIGALQFDFLREQGLTPDSRLLDLGCGTLRGGRHFIRYLNRSNYTGIDIAPACIDAARELVEAEQFEEKAPTLILNTSKNLKFTELEGDKFDYILAQSVFTHLPVELVRECFEHIGRVMDDDCRFYFTYWWGGAYEKFGEKEFRYPWETLVDLAAEYAFEATELSNEYAHPLNQRMGMIKKT